MRIRKKSNPLEVRIKKVFGYKNMLFMPGIYYDFPVALRFKLGEEGGNDNIYRFIYAIERLEVLFNNLFEDSKSITVLLYFFIYNKKRKESENIHKLIEECGFKTLKQYLFSKIRSKYDFGAADCWVDQYAFKVKNSFHEFIPLFWAITGNEIGILPTASFKAYLIDFDKGIIFHEYDDRGLDIVATRKELIRPLYEKYNHWLVTDEKGKMKNLFEM